MLRSAASSQVDDDSSVILSTVCNGRLPTAKDWENEKQNAIFSLHDKWRMTSARRMAARKKIPTRNQRPAIGTRVNEWLWARDYPLVALESSSSCARNKCSPSKKSGKLWKTRRSTHNTKSDAFAYKIYGMLPLESYDLTLAQHSSWRVFTLTVLWREFTHPAWGCQNWFFKNQISRNPLVVLPFPNLATWLPI